MCFTSQHIVTHRHRQWGLMLLHVKTVAVHIIGTTAVVPHPVDRRRWWAIVIRGRLSAMSHRRRGLLFVGELAMAIWGPGIQFVRLGMSFSLVMAIVLVRDEVVTAVYRAVALWNLSVVCWCSVRLLGRGRVVVLEASP